MVDNSWFRRQTWTSDDRTAFFARLGRSRDAYHKAQYCRVQAYTLQQAGNYGAALELLELIMREWWSAAEHSLVFWQKAECLVAMGELAEAVQCYREVFGIQRKDRGTITNAHLGFGWLVVNTPYRELYDEVLAALEEFASTAFPVEEFETAAIRALIYAAQGDRELSGRHARIALAASRKRHSGLAYHARLGLVESIDGDLEGRLRELGES
jgi:tetratricopeptide (TPR) repeat protein